MVFLLRDCADTPEALVLSLTSSVTLEKQFLLVFSKVSTFFPQSQWKFRLLKGLDNFVPNYYGNLVHIIFLVLRIK